MPACLRALAALALIPLSGLIAAPADADQSKIYAPGGVALSGYDVVTYFTEPAPRRGSPDHALMWHGATWYFSSPETLMKFEMNPQAYAPQFGGYCVYALSEGRVGNSSPESYVLRSGKLYLLGNPAMARSASQGMEKVIERAETQWPAALGQ